MAAYDPNKNCWLALDIKGARAYGNGFGMRYDEKRKLIWGVGTRGDVYVMKLDLEKAIVHENAENRGASKHIQPSVPRIPKSWAMDSGWDASGDTSRSTALP
jgi:hypothetical protein